LRDSASNDPDNLPTWKKLSQDTAAGQAFYSNAFGIQAPKRDNFDQSNSLPDYLQKAVGNPKKRSYNDMQNDNLDDGAFRVGGVRRDPQQLFN